MKLTKKQIGKFFDVRGGDGSWAYLLVDVKRKDLLFLAIPSGNFEIDSRRHSDWRPYELGAWLPGQHLKNTKEVILDGWKNGRRAK